MRDNPDDLLPIVYLSLSRLAPAYEGVELGLGEALLVKAMAASSGRTVARIKADCDELGDLGLVAQQSRSCQTLMMKPKALDVDSLYLALIKIAKTPALNKRVEQVQRLFVACEAEGSEAKYLFRLLEGKLRIGLAEQTLLAALAHATCKHHAEVMERDPVEVLKAVYTALPSYHCIIPVLLEHGLKALPSHCSLTPGVPLKPMLAMPTKSITEVLDRFEGLPFTCEFKYDGERAQIHRLADGRIEIFSRNSENMSAKYPDLISAMPKVMTA